MKNLESEASRGDADRARPPLSAPAPQARVVDDSAARPTRLQRAAALLVVSAIGSFAAGAATLAAVIHRETANSPSGTGAGFDPFVRDVFCGAVGFACLWTWGWALALVPRECPPRHLALAAIAMVGIQAALAFAMPLRFAMIGAALLPPVSFLLLASVGRK